MVVLSARTGGRVKRFSDFFDEDFELIGGHAEVPTVRTGVVAPSVPATHIRRLALRRNQLLRAHRFEGCADLVDLFAAVGAAGGFDQSADADDVLDVAGQLVHVCIIVWVGLNRKNILEIVLIVSACELRT